ncbi:hypothetical protein FZC84_04000 [Rossellomorea vietnamensis]|uniref:DUF4367 domain-containing protein n=1 Tax=Rossellomorea vietnamensis TaxID=218284 RepID=A0A5D4MGU9_9BACI|nr:MULTISPECIES: hypothetical protein [Bacillaceae]TYS00669.1 hypothetical protein FZC84_04000 [Rossellomorea vietnamensis]
MKNYKLQESASIRSGKRKFWFAKTLSGVFIAACLSLFVFFGAANLGLIETENGDSVPSGFYKTDRDQLELPAELKFPEIIPFVMTEISLVENAGMEAHSPAPYWIKIEGKEEQVLHLSYTPGARFVDQTDEDLPESIRETSVEIEALKVNGTVGNYHETRFSSILSWQEEDVSVTVSYEKGGSDKMIGSSELLAVAESFR